MFTFFFFGPFMLTEVTENIIGHALWVGEMLLTSLLLMYFKRLTINLYKHTHTYPPNTYTHTNTHYFFSSFIFWSLSESQWIQGQFQEHSDGIPVHCPLQGTTHTSTQINFHCSEHTVTGEQAQTSTWAQDWAVSSEAATLPAMPLWQSHLLWSS